LPEICYLMNSATKSIINEKKGIRSCTWFLAAMDRGWRNSGIHCQCALKQPKSDVMDQGEDLYNEGK
jgi:hypothetical protein